MASKRTIQTARGMRDFLPDDYSFRKLIIQKISKFYELYGFREIETPALEYLDILNAKSGDEIAGQIFKIENSKIGMRFDLTVPLARVVSQYSFAKPFKRYALGRVWRREEPQKGRYREFWQADADIIGSSSMECEIELLTMMYRLLSDFDFPNTKLKLNNRKILNGIADKLGLKNRNTIFRELDKLDKVGEYAVKESLSKIVDTKALEAITKIFFATKGKNSLDNFRKFSEEGVRELEQIIRGVSELTKNKFDVEFDPTLVRGLGYYTGPIYEIKLSDELGTIVAGGRYDTLIGLYGEPESAVGISLGIDRFIEVLKIVGYLPKNERQKKMFYIATVKKELLPKVRMLAEGLRDNGLIVSYDLKNRNLRKQMEYASSTGAHYVLVVGEKELSSGKYTLRDMKTGEQKSVSLDQLKGML